MPQASGGAVCAQRKGEQKMRTLWLVVVLVVLGCGPTADEIKDDCHGDGDFLSCSSTGGYSDQCCCYTFEDGSEVYARCN